MKCINEAVGGIHGWMDRPGCSSSDVEKTPWLQSANQYEYDFFPSCSSRLLFFWRVTTGDSRMSVSSSEESSLDSAAELAQRVSESAGVVMAMPTMDSASSTSYHGLY
ncbi:hypothetical protein EV421DRAFT_2088799 [Armillaria borealis]|uniref:Uncharacterized protein n=1 Tax=Armillaria borealis TaxID=47425 RepID=A0AA39IZL6_9AGAR|nr:hypothetical protein EV421DRAFT_2088799 [Armillaria borealis]